MERGYISLGKVAGIPIRAHWTAPLIAFLFAGSSPISWFCLFALIFIHELGHAALVRACGCHVEEIAFSGFGGFCRWRGEASEAESRLISWGGVAAQGAVYWVAIVATTAGWQPSGPFEITTYHYMTAVNVRLMLFNLIPVPPFDGWNAWPLFKTLWTDIRDFDAYQAARPKLRLVPTPPPRVSLPGEDNLDAEEAAAAAKEAQFQRVLKGLTRPTPIPVEEDEE